MIQTIHLPVTEGALTYKVRRGTRLLPGVMSVLDPVQLVVTTLVPAEVVPLHDVKFTILRPVIEVDAAELGTYLGSIRLPRHTGVEHISVFALEKS
jgi:hypothetical protein